MFQGLRDVLKVRNSVRWFWILTFTFTDNGGDSDDNEHDSHHPNRDVDVLKVGDLFNCLPITSMIMSEYDDYSHGDRYVDHDDNQGGRGEDSGVESAHSLGGTRGEFW